MGRSKSGIISGLIAFFTSYIDRKYLSIYLNKEENEMIKLDIFSNADLAIVKSLKWCGGATIIHKDEYGIIYYTVFVKPKNLIEKIITQYVLKDLKCTFQKDIAA